LRYPNGNELEAQKGAHETVEEDVHEELSDNGKAIIQPLDDVHSRPICVGK